jgi:hypothetical protein
MYRWFLQHNQRDHRRRRTSKHNPTSVLVEHMLLTAQKVEGWRHRPRSPGRAFSWRGSAARRCALLRAQTHGSWERRGCPPARRFGVGIVSCLFKGNRSVLRSCHDGSIPPKRPDGWIAKVEGDGGFGLYWYCSDQVERHKRDKTK